MIKKKGSYLKLKVLGMSLKLKLKVLIKYN
jgi:hypothetical protein